jgi:hypothetical protein
VLPIIREAQKGGRTHAAGDCGGTQRTGHRHGTRGAMVRPIGRERPCAGLGRAG